MGRGRAGQGRGRGGGEGGGGEGRGPDHPPPRPQPQSHPASSRALPPTSPNENIAITGVLLRVRLSPAPFVHMSTLGGPTWSTTRKFEQSCRDNLRDSTTPRPISVTTVQEINLLHPTMYDINTTSYISYLSSPYQVFIYTVEPAPKLPITILLTQLAPWELCNDTPWALPIH